jgi:competence protein ComGC
MENPEDEKVCISCSQPLPVEPDAPPLPPAAKTSALAIWSFVLAMLGLFTFMITALPALICGIVGLIKISKSSGRLKGTGFAITGIVVPVVYVFLVLPIMLAILMPALGKARQLSQRIICSNNISGLGKAIVVYTNDHNGAYPPTDKWCDVLVKDCDVTWEQLRCPADNKKENKSSYAFNINLAGRRDSEVPPDTVLLFETTPAANPAGGAELLSTEKHQGDGCNILFADYHTKFVKTSDISKLRWKPE